MKTAILRRICLLLAAVLLLALAGCGSGEPAASLPSYQEQKDAYQSTADAQLENKLQYAMPSAWTLVGDRMWTWGECGVDKSSGRPVTQYAAVNLALDGSDTVFGAPQSLTTPPDIPLGDGQRVASEVTHLLADASGSMYALRGDRLMDSGDCISHRYALCRTDETGLLDAGVRLQFPDLTTLVIRNAFFDNEGNLWLSYYTYADTDDKSIVFISALCCFSAADGSLKKQFDLPGSFAMPERPALLLADGSILVYGQDLTVLPAGPETLHCYILRDPLAQDAVLEDVDIPRHDLDGSTNFVSFAGSTPEQVFVELKDGVYAWDMQGGVLEPMFLWQDHGIGRKTIQTMFMPSADRLLLVTQKDEKADYQFVTLAPMGEEILAGRPVVTLGALNDGTDTVKQAVEAYNLTAPEVYVKLLDYSDAAAAEKGLSSGYELLENDLRSLAGPDILLANPLNMATYIRKGMFVDLYPYIDADSELARTDFVPNVLAAGEYDGQLPTAVLSYRIQTAVGDSDVVGNTPGWSWAEYNALAAAYPNAVPFHGYTREYILLYLLQQGGDRFIDYAGSRADLNSPDFITLLQTTAGYPTQQGDSMADPKPVFANRQALLKIAIVSSYRSVLTDEYDFDGPVSYKGFPNDSGSGSAAIPDLRVAISSTCADPDAAWTFVRTLLLPAFQDKMAERNSFPLRVDSLQTMAAAAMQTTETGYSTPAYLGTDLTEEQLDYFKQGLTQAQADQITALVQSVTTLYQYDRAIADILFEEADAFFSGARTAQEAAAIMQNRVQTYLDEQS